MRGRMHHINAGVLNLGTSDTWGQIMLCYGVGGVGVGESYSFIGCVAASLLFTH